MDHVALAEQLTHLLSLRRPPVGLAFASQQPEGMPTADGPVPSACAFWRRAERGTFFATAAQHFNCPVGSMVMGFDLPDEVGARLGELVQSMCDAHYLGADEASKIPSVGGHSAGVIYGPLREFREVPDAVLMWMNVAQAMLYSEAAGSAAWTSTPMEVSGRPGCAAVPLAMRSGGPRMSLGCVGMRTFTEVGDDEALAVVPGSAAQGFADALARTAESNAAMRSFYLAHKASIT